MAIELQRQYQPGEYGTDINTEVGVFPTVAGTATTTINIGCDYRVQVFRQGFVSQIALIIPTSGTVTVTIGKMDSTNSGTKVPLTAATNLVTGQTAKQTGVIPALGTLTDQQRTVLPADLLYADFIASAAITTQATAGIIGAELFLVK